MSPIKYCKCISVLYLFLFLKSCNSIKNSGSFGLIKAPSVFRSDEENMHKYAAILAATEPFRNLCTQQIKFAMNPLQYFIYCLKGQPIVNQATEMRSKNKAIDLAYERYEIRVENTLR